jgi:hypothetical protein
MYPAKTYSKMIKALNKPVGSIKGMKDTSLDFLNKSLSKINKAIVSGAIAAGTAFKSTKKAIISGAIATSSAFKSTKKAIISGAIAAGTALKPSNFKATAAAGVVGGTKLLSKTFSLFKSLLVPSVATTLTAISGFVVGAVAALALLGVAVVGAYFKVDKFIGKAITWVSKNIFKPIAIGVSRFFESWKNGFAQISRRAEWMTKQYNEQVALNQISEEQRKAYTQQVTQDLTSKGWELAVEEQINDLKKLWKKQDEKTDMEVKRIADHMFFKERF